MAIWGEGGGHWPGQAMHMSYIVGIKGGGARQILSWYDNVLNNQPKRVKYKYQEV